MNEEALAEARKEFDRSGDLRRSIHAYLEAERPNKFVGLMLRPDEAQILDRVRLEGGVIVNVKTGKPRYLDESRDGYFRVRINGKKYLAHRIVWLLRYGEWPLFLIDHIDRDKKNNSVGNLRKTNHSLNAMNVGPIVRNDQGPVA